MPAIRAFGRYDVDAHGASSTNMPLWRGEEGDVQATESHHRLAPGEQPHAHSGHMEIRNPDGSTAVTFDNSSFTVGGETGGVGDEQPKHSSPGPRERLRGKSMASIPELPWERDRGES